MYCVLDFVHDGRHASTGDVSKGNDILVLPVNVFSPSFTPLPLQAHFNMDGISQDVDRADGDIDGRGSTLPAELMPPYVPRPAVGTGPAASPLYPSGLWYRPLNALNSSRVSFMYPGKSNSVPNMVAAAGQQIQFPALQRNAVHLLALCTEEDLAAEFTLVYTDGTQERKRVSFTHWNQPPKHGERVGFYAPHRHTPTGDDVATRCYINHYTIAADPTKTLIGIELPRLRALKVLALTLEAAAARPN